MKQKLLNGFEINSIGIGTWMMGGSFYPESRMPYAVYDHDQRDIDAIKYSISQGQNHIHTAQMYGAGHTEELVGKAIRDIERSKLFIAETLWKTHAKRTSVIPAVEEMLRKLGTDYLDMLYIHGPWSELPMEEYISGVNDALDAGLTKSLAVSNFNLEQLKQAMEISKYPIIANQLRYNILYKTDANDEMLEFCRENDIMIVAYRPVERKLLADEVEEKVVKEIADKYDKTPAQIALNWLISQDKVIAIPKASSKKHIDENLGALEFELEREDFEKLIELPSID